MEDRLEAGRGGTDDEGSDAQGHVTKQPLLGAATAAVSQGGGHLVLLRWHVQTLVAINVEQCEVLRREEWETGHCQCKLIINLQKNNKKTPI